MHPCAIGNDPPLLRYLSLPDIARHDRAIHEAMVPQGVPAATGKRHFQNARKHPLMDRRIKSGDDENKLRGNGTSVTVNAACDFSHMRERENVLKQLTGIG